MTAASRPSGLSARTKPILPEARFRMPHRWRARCSGNAWAMLSARVQVKLKSSASDKFHSRLKLSAIRTQVRSQQLHANHQVEDFHRERLRSNIGIDRSAP